ncbi:MAG: antibiotic biosynthesis monooxygenase family protein [Chlamydiota bacterium]
MYIIAWEFVVRAECVAHFEAAYGPQGDWARLFARAEDYRDTRLLHDASDPLRYVTLDYWLSQEAHVQFRKAHQQEYRNLDQRCERLTVKETKLGEFYTD